MTEQLETFISDRYKCKYCNSYMGVCKTKRSVNNKYKTDYFLSKPKVINGIHYFRVACVNCFFKKFGDLPGAPNILNINELTFLLEVPRDIAVEVVSPRKATLDNMIKKYGEEYGSKKYEKYLEIQRLTNTFEYKNSVYGWNEAEFKEYNLSRASTRENFIKKHGEEAGARKFEEYCKRQAYAGITLEYFIEKYGEVDGTNEYNRICKLKKHSLDNFVQKYGEVDGKIRYESYLERVSCGRSIIASTLFSEIHKIGYPANSNEIKYSPYSQEYFLRFKGTPIFYVDFIDINQKKIIEFFGDYWHLNPIMYDVGFVNPSNNLSTEEIWKKDYQRINELIKHGYSVKVIWERDFTRSKQKVILDCLNFLGKTVYDKVSF